MGTLNKPKKLVGLVRSDEATIAENVDGRSSRFDEHDVEKAVDKAADVAGESSSDGGNTGT